MSKSLLEFFRSDDFADSIGFVLPPAALRISLQRSHAVRRAATALRRGAITEPMIASFVSELIDGFQKGVQLRDDLAMAAVAVVLEQQPSEFAEEYLCNLSRLQLREMVASIRVARECLKNRYRFPKTEVRTFRYPTELVEPPRTWVAENVRVERRLPTVRYRQFAET